MQQTRRCRWVTDTGTGFGANDPLSLWDENFIRSIAVDFTDRGAGQLCGAIARTGAQRGVDADHG